MGIAGIEKRARFDQIRYANCWEDAAVVVEALGPLKDARCLSIASAGDNTLSLLARGVASVLALDVSHAQLALLELKLLAFRCLSHSEVLAFLGVEASAERLRTYAAMRGQLAGAVRAFWDARPLTITRGVLHAGKLERYFGVFRRFLLPLTHGRSAIEHLLAPAERGERERLYDQVFDNWRWRAMGRLFFGRMVMGRLGRDPEFFRFAAGPVAPSVLGRTREAFTETPPGENPYLCYILTGAFGPALPDYLRPENHAAIREGSGRVRLHCGPVEEALLALDRQSLDAFNLSNVAEYMDEPGYHRLLQGVRRVAAPGARLAYWNLLASRHRPASMAAWLEEREAEAARLHRGARAFFYRDLVLEVVR
jgi:S-adenosylmethionine-diacylglycerol 3-amino-3-carboxypropyl transferase